MGSHCNLNKVSGCRDSWITLLPPDETAGQCACFLTVAVDDLAGNNRGQDAPAGSDITLLTFGESRIKKGAAISSSFIRWEKSATV